MTNTILKALYVYLIYVFVGDTCLSPAVETQVYTTGESSVSSDTVVVTEFTVTCKNGLKVCVLFTSVVNSKCSSHTNLIFSDPSFIKHLPLKCFSLYYMKIKLCLLKLFFRKICPIYVPHPCVLCCRTWASTLSSWARPPLPVVWLVPTSTRCAMGDDWIDNFTWVYYGVDQNPKSEAIYKQGSHLIYVFLIMYSIIKMVYVMHSYTCSSNVPCPFPSIFY